MSGLRGFNPTGGNRAAFSFRFPRDHILQRYLQRLRQGGQDVRVAFAIPFPIALGLVFLLPRGWID
jgi:hypothetical protein